MDRQVESPSEFDSKSVTAGIGVISADFNSDGIPDLAVITPDAELVVLLGAKPGLYRQAFRCMLGGGARGLYAEDLDGDGLLDLVIAHGGRGVGVLHGNGDGTFAPSPGVTARTPTWSLTPREHEVAELAARGHTCKEIAGQLGISRRTVEAHVNAIRSKLELRHKRHLVRVGRPAGS